MTRLSDATQAGMDELLGVGETQIIVPSEGSGKSRRDSVYSQALRAAQAAFPSDGVAAHRAAMKAADAASRRTPMHTHTTPNEEARKNIDAALLNAFPEDASASGGRGRLSVVEIGDGYVTARGQDGELYKVSYTVKDGGGVAFGTPEEIEEDGPDEPDDSGAPKK
jgi:hypothetical protein